MGFSLHDPRFYLYFCFRSFGLPLSKPQVAGPSPLPSTSKLLDASMLLNLPTAGLGGSEIGFCTATTFFY